MWNRLLLLAQDPKEAAKGPESPPWFNFLPFILLIIVFYFLFLGPGRRQRQEQATMLKALKKNDEVITHGGIIGVVVNLREGSEEITIKSDETKLRLLKSSIARVVPAKDTTENK